MNNKKIILSLFLVLLVAISLSSVSADDSSDVISSDDADDVVAIDDASESLSADPIKPDNSSVEAVQKAVDSASSGSIVDLSGNAVYDFNSSGVTINAENITLKGNGSTIIKGYGDEDGLISIKASNVIIQGINFIDTNPKNNLTYGGSINGWGVVFRSVSSGNVNNCNFTDFNQAVRIMASDDILIENNNFNGGYSTFIINDPTVNKESGSKVLSLTGSSSRVTVKGNIFTGPVLDAISIAQGSGSNVVFNNTFIGNVYSIYFGGASTKNTILANNTFINCGQFMLDGKNWTGMPVISAQKASDNFRAENNTFEAVDNNILIATEQGNEAHGYPSPLGNINVTGNTVNLYNESVDSSNITLFSVYVRGDNNLHLFAPLIVKDNTLADGVTGFKLSFENSEVVIKENEAVLTNLVTYVPVNNSVEAVQKAIDLATNAGDVVDLSQFSYDFGNSTINITNSNIIIKGLNGTSNANIKGNGFGNGIFYITGSNVTVFGFNFIDTNPYSNPVYGGSVNGTAITINGAKLGLISNCTFKDFGNGIIAMASNGLIIENNTFTGGYTTIIANDPTVNVEKGTKALNIYRQSSNVIVRGNTFIGPILDGVSIAQGSGSNYVINNTFINNTYSIYFGGSSTKNSLIANNTFINCGEFKRDGQNWTKLPVISIQKASNDIAIVNNTFKAIDNNILIAAEQGNEAHGFPSSLGNINVTGNTVELYNDSVNPSSVTLFHILVRNGELLVFAPINVTDNTVASGVKQVIIWNNDWGNETDQTDGMVIPVIEDNPTPSLTASDITFTAGESGTIKVTLLDGKTKLSNRPISITFNGVTTNVTTNKDGEATLDVSSSDAGTYYATIAFVGDHDYKASIVSAKVTVDAKVTPAPVVVKVTPTLTVKKATLKVKKAKKISVTLKGSGKAIAGKVVTIKVNGKTFKAKTNSKGVASVSVKITKKGKFTAKVSFAGDNAYNTVTKSVKLTVKK